MRVKRRQVILAVAMLLAVQCPFIGAEGPKWLEQTVVAEGDCVFAVGHSQMHADEREARNEAVANAVKEFVRYCRISVDSFDRSVEVYAKSDGKTYRAADYKTQNVIRAKAFVTGTIPEEWYVIQEKGMFRASVFLKVPKEEFERISGESNVKLSMDVLFYHEDGKGAMRAFSQGEVLSSGEGYAVYFKPSDTCYVYVYQVDQAGKSFRLFPGGEYKAGENPVAAASDVWVPSNDNLLVLDETTGKEHVLIFASLDPIPELEGEQAATITRKDMDNIVAIKKMGVAGIRRKRETGRVSPPKREARDVVDVKNKLLADGAFVYETWFWHK